MCERGVTFGPHARPPHPPADEVRIGDVTETFGWRPARRLLSLAGSLNRALCRNHDGGCCFEGYRVLAESCCGIED